MTTLFAVYDKNGTKTLACGDCIEKLLPDAMYVETIFTLDDLDTGHDHIPSKPMTHAAIFRKN